MERGLPPWKVLANYLLITKEEDMYIAKTLQKLLDNKELTKDEIGALFLYVRQANFDRL